MNEISEDNPTKPTKDDEIARIERNNFLQQRNLDERLEAIERSLNKLSYHVAGLEDAISHIARIPNYPLELEYDHKTNTLWAESRRKLEFNKHEAVIMAMMFTLRTGKPKSKTFYCGEVAATMKAERQGLGTAKLVAQTAKRVQKKLDDFLNTKEAMVVSSKSFYFSKLALK